MDSKWTRRLSTLGESSSTRRCPSREQRCGTGYVMMGKTCMIPPSFPDGVKLANVPGQGKMFCLLTIRIFLVSFFHFFFLIINREPKHLGERFSFPPLKAGKKERK
jgi:hypothetical protein